MIQSWPSGGLRLVTDKTTEKNPRVKHEPRSAHGRAVKKPKAEQETAQPTAAHLCPEMQAVAKMADLTKFRQLT